MNHHKEHGMEHTAQYSSEDTDGKLVTGLRDISHTMRALYEGRGSQKRILIVLSETGTITQRELTQRLGIQPGSASEVIAKLENMGLVERTLSEADRRTADISLTEAGREQAQEALRQRRQRHEEMFSALTEAEKEQLLSLLEKLNGDWAERYCDSRHQDGHFHHHEGHGRHGHHHEGHAHHEHHREGHFGPHDHGGDQEFGGGRGCDHDCAHCGHPCGRGRNR